MSALTLAICNQKGGVGKSTTAYHLAREAVRAGQRVLVVDADPQGSITQVMTGEEVPDDDAQLADVLSARESETAADVIVPGVWDGLSILPTSGVALGGVRDELVIAGAGRETRLREALAPVAQDYDLILIDCAPSLDQLTINGLTAADAVVIVTQSKLWSTQGLTQLLETIWNVSRYYAPALKVAGIIVNQHESNTIAGGHWLAQLTEIATDQGLQVLTPPMPKRVAIADATEASVGLDQWGTPEARELATMYRQYLDALTKKES